MREVLRGRRARRRPEKRRKEVVRTSGEEVEKGALERAGEMGGSRLRGSPEEVTGGGCQRRS